LEAEVINLEARHFGVPVEVELVEVEFVPVEFDADEEATGKDVEELGEDPYPALEDDVDPAADVVLA
jgi:hypothetical protein